MNEEYSKNRLSLNKTIARCIASFYLEKSSPLFTEVSDMYLDANKNIQALNITKISVSYYTENKDKTIIKIRLGRPGLLIGESGKNFDALNEYLKKLLKIKFQIKLEEERVLDSLYLYDPQMMDDFDCCDDCTCDEEDWD